MSDAAPSPSGSQAWRKVPIGVSFTSELLDTLEAWTDDLNESWLSLDAARKPATRSDTIQAMARALLAAGWRPGLTVQLVPSPARLSGNKTGRPVSTPRRPAQQ
jgi:hypothetical protein